MKHLVALACLVPFFCACSHAPMHRTALSLDPEHRAAPGQPPAPAERLRVATYNVHFAADVPRLVAEIQGNALLREADVLLLQEVRAYPAEGQSRTARLAAALGMGYVYAPAHATGDGGTHGLALLSRYPITGPEVIELPAYPVGGGVERRIALRATLDVGGRALRVYNVHLDTRINAAQRQQQLAPVLADAEGAGAVLVGGDCNTNPFRWLRGRVPIARAAQAHALDAFMKEHGYAAPTAPYASTVTTRLLRMRLDALYVRGLDSGGSGVERTVTASDHVPLWLDVRWPSEG